MSLFSQIQAFVGSIILGYITSLLWILLKTFLEEIKPQFIRLFIEAPFFIIVFYLYDLFLIHVIDGVLNVFYLLALVIGIFIYFKFYNKYFSLYFKNIKNKIKTKILNPIYLKLHKIKDILKKKRLERKKKRYEKRKAKTQDT